MYKTFDQCRRLFEGLDESSDPNASPAAWRFHWENARNAIESTVVRNLLKNHIRLLNDHPERNNGNERENIIRFLRNKLMEATNEKPHD